MFDQDFVLWVFPLHHEFVDVDAATSQLQPALMDSMMFYESQEEYFFLF